MEKRLDTLVKSVASLGINPRQQNQIDGNPLRAFNTTFIMKVIKGPRLIAVPKGNSFAISVDVTTVTNWKIG